MLATSRKRVYVPEKVVGDVTIEFNANDDFDSGAKETDDQSENEQPSNLVSFDSGQKLSRKSKKSRKYQATQPENMPSNQQTKTKHSHQETIFKRAKEIQCGFGKKNGLKMFPHFCAVVNLLKRLRRVRYDGPRGPKCVMYQPSYLFGEYSWNSSTFSYIRNHPGLYAMFAIGLRLFRFSSEKFYEVRRDFFSRYRKHLWEQFLREFPEMVARWKNETSKPASEVLKKWRGKKLEEVQKEVFNSIGEAFCPSWNCEGKYKSENIAKFEADVTRIGNTMRLYLRYIDSFSVSSPAEYDRLFEIVKTMQPGLHKEKRRPNKKEVIKESISNSGGSRGQASYSSDVLNNNSDKTFDVDTLVDDCLRPRKRHHPTADNSISKNEESYCDSTQRLHSELSTLGTSLGRGTSDCSDTGESEECLRDTDLSNRSATAIAERLASPSLVLIGATTLESKPFCQNCGAIVDLKDFGAQYSPSMTD
mmetsp:Transcript_50933/g.58412  ORF Transcript_50933/g.58412 Transcript_50933/m.58412 type:complete len:476 (-) Transcript_50933:893-2320(-)